MVQDAEAHKAEDEKRKATVDLRNKLDAVISQAEKFITENESVDTAELESFIEEGKTILKDNPDDTDKLKSSEEKIMAAFQAASAKMHEHQAQTEQHSSEAQGNSSDAEDEIIDAEIE